MKTTPSEGRFHVVMLALSHCNPEVRLEKEARYTARKSYFRTTVVGWNKDGNLPDFEERWGAPVYRLPPALPKGFGQYPLWRQVASKFLKILSFSYRAIVLCRRLKPDVLVFHDLHAAHIGVAVKLLTGARIVYDAHEDYPAMLRENSWFLWCAAELLERLVAPFVDYVVAVDRHRAGKFSSKLGRKTIIAQNFPEEWFTHKPERPASAEAAPVVAQLQKLKDEGTFVVLSSTLFGLNNGLEELILSKTYLPTHLKVAYVIVGWGNCGPALKALIEEHGLKNVFLPGRLPYSDVPHFMQLADVGVDLKAPIPYYLTVFPTKISEYLACGIPIISGPLPDVIPLIEAGCGLQVDSQSPQDIARAIAQLAQNRELYLSVKEKAVRVGKDFTWEAHTPKFDKMFSEILPLSESGFVNGIPSGPSNRIEA